MQPAPIKGNKSESAEAIQQPKLVSIFNHLDIKRFQHTLIKSADDDDDDTYKLLGPMYVLLLCKNREQFEGYSTTFWERIIT